MRAAGRYLLGRAGPVGTGSAWSPLAFPLVGLLVGVAWVLGSRILLVLPRTTAVAAAGILLIDALLTGALHLRAFSQAVDGFPAARPAGRTGPWTASRPRGATPVHPVPGAHPEAQEQQDEAPGLRPAFGAGPSLLLLMVLLRFGVLFFAAEFDQRLLTVPLAGRAAMLWLLWRSTGDDPRSGPLAGTLGRPAPLALAAAAVLSVAGSVVAGTRGLVALGLAVATGLLWDLRLQQIHRARTGVEVAAGGFVAETVALLALGSV